MITMQRASALFLQAVLVLIGIAALAVMIWEPRMEGFNAHATSFAEIYLDDPFLAYGYVASLSVFAALYQAFKVVGLAAQGAAFSAAMVRALRRMRTFAFAMIGFVAGGEIWILQASSDDRAGGVAMGVFISLAALVIAAAATLCERIAQDGLRARTG
jgi:hypothetical protein